MAARSGASRAGGAAGGLLLVALAATLWGTTGSTLRLVGTAAGALPLIVGASRMAVAAPLLGLSAALREGRSAPAGRAFLPAGACIAAYQVCYFSAVPLAGVAVTALLAICSAPILVAVLARLVLGERLGPPQLAALVLGVLGAGLLVSGGLGGTGSRFVLGTVLALGAGLAYALYTVLTKGALAHAPPLWLSAWTFTVAAVALLPLFPAFSMVAGAAWRQHWPLLLYLGAVPTAAAYWLYVSGLRRIPASSGAIASLLEPLTATILGAVLFGEHLAPISAAGALLLAAAVLLLLVRPG